MATADDRSPRAAERKSEPPPTGSITAKPPRTLRITPNRVGLVASFRYAFAGLAYCFRTQRNFRIHLAISVIVALAGVLLGLSWLEWAVIAVLVVVVLSAEMVNTMVESLVDLVTEEYHPLAKVAKDVAAGVVLLSAIGSVVIGALIFVPRIVALFVK